MAVMRSGIMGPVSGKVGGVVGASWKGQNYVRAHVVPGLSETAAQLAQRARFAYVVASAKYFVGRIFNPYYDKFLSKVSGFNRYVTNNIPKAPAFTPITAYQVTDGPLFPGSALEVEYDTADGGADVTYSTEDGIDGDTTDVAIAWMRNRVTNQVWFSANTTRGAGATTIAAAAGLDPADMDCGVFFAQMSGTRVVKISRNLSAQATALY